MRPAPECGTVPAGRMPNANADPVLGQLAFAAAVATKADTQSRGEGNLGHSLDQVEAAPEPIPSALAVGATSPVHGRPTEFLHSIHFTCPQSPHAHDRPWRWAREQICAVAFAGFILSLLSFWPGFMEFDSFDQYAQAIGQEPLNDWHPIIMALLWRLLIAVHDGPQPMLLLQMALYWSGFLYLALQILRRPGRAPVAIAAIIAPFFPFLLNFSGVLWKDTQLALALFWTSLILTFAPRSIVSLVTSLALIFYGLAVRHNGITAALPLLVLWSYDFAAVLGLRNSIAVPLLTASAVATLLVANIALGELVTVEKTHPLHHQMLNEIAFIQCQSKGPLDILRSYQGEALERLNEIDKQTRLCGQNYSLAAEGDTDDIFERQLLKTPEGDDPSVFPAWLQTVSSHPLEYLEYRLIVYRTFLRPFSYAHPYYIFCDGTDNNPYPDRFSAEPANPLHLTKLLAHYVRFAAKRFDLFFRPLFWLIALTVTAGLSLWKRNFPASLICLSGLFYLAAYLLFLPAPDFRYAYWAIFAQTLSSFLLLSSYPRREPYYPRREP